MESSVSKMSWGLIPGFSHKKRRNRKMAWPNPGMLQPILETPDGIRLIRALSLALICVSYLLSISLNISGRILTEFLWLSA